MGRMRQRKEPSSPVSTWNRDPNGPPINGFTENARKNPSRSNRDTRSVFLFLFRRRWNRGSRLAGVTSSSLCFLSVFLSVSLFHFVSTLSKVRLSQQSRLCWKPTELFIPSLPDLISPVAEETFVALAVRTVFTGSEIVIGGSRGVFSTVMYHCGLHSIDIASLPRSTSFDGSELFAPSSPANKLMFEGSMYLHFPATALYLLSWADSVDQRLNYGFGKNLWFRHGNVGYRSLCLTLATASSSSDPVKLIYLNAVVKVARPSLSGLKHPSLATVIHI
ncbi:hypothetical protein F2Q70_00002291 [Brassica cretica]|uniref:Uncharacterized protein n=1 Tax=Brassica cretica TaxID=69181 RepID=A0A8S9IS61_BRACR|nr:hypothetical protein F2Q70_00002291 [Brassica cretica]